MSVACGLLMLAVGALITWLALTAATALLIYVFPLVLFAAGGLTLLRGFWQVVSSSKVLRPLLRTFIEFED